MINISIEKWPIHTHNEPWQILLRVTDAVHVHNIMHCVCQGSTCVPLSHRSKSHNFWKMYMHTHTAIKKCPRLLLLLEVAKFVDNKVCSVDEALHAVGEALLRA